MRPHEILTPVRTFCFDHFTVDNQIDVRIKSRAIRRQTICRESLIRNVLYWKRGIMYIASVFNVLQSCDAGRLVGRFYVTDHSSKRIVFISQSFRCGSHHRCMSRQIFGGAKDFWPKCPKLA